MHLNVELFEPAGHLFERDHPQSPSVAITARSLYARHLQSRELPDCWVLRRGRGIEPDKCWPLGTLCLEARDLLFVEHQCDDLTLSRHPQQVRLVRTLLERVCLKSQPMISASQAPPTCRRTM